MKYNKLFIIILSIVLMIILSTLLIFIVNNINSGKSYNNTDMATLNDPLKNFTLEDVINEGCFVITGDRIYNKDALEIFINNTDINAKNRIADKIRIVEYNYDGYPTIYDLEYKIYDETYINSEQKEVHKTGYVLTTDARRNNINPTDITTNDDIPGEYYSITLTEDSGINAAILSFSLYAEVNTSAISSKPYTDIEIARYLLTDKNINSIDIHQIINNPVSIGLVELNHNGYIYMFGGQHFGELGYEIEEYTSASIDNNNQICIDYLTLKKYDTRYIEEGDLLIRTRKSDDTLDTKDNPIIVLKKDDYREMQKDVITRKRKSTVIAGDIYEYENYLYLKYDFEDSTHYSKTYHFPFILKVYLTKDTQIIGNLQKGSILEIQYNENSQQYDGLELKSIKVIK